MVDYSSEEMLLFEYYLPSNNQPCLNKFRVSYIPYYSLDSIADLSYANFVSSIMIY